MKRLAAALALGSAASLVAGEGMGRELSSRLCVNALRAADVVAAAGELPFGCWKDFGTRGAPLEAAGRSIGYTPVLLWRGDRDTAEHRAHLAEAFRAGRVAGAASLDDLLDEVALERLAARIGADPGRLPEGTLFLLGIEPGYAPADDRSPAQIASDAHRLRALLEGFRRGYRLGLGGISTQHTEWVRRAYGGRDGLAQLRAILDAAPPPRFDALTIHPYPSDPRAPDAAETLRQVRAFRTEMAARGLRDLPLIVGEVGTPFAATSPEAAARFAREVLPALLGAVDPGIGNPDDDDHLVQRVDWMMLRAPTVPIPGFTDNPALDLGRSALVGADGAPTAVGESFRRLDE